MWEIYGLRGKGGDFSVKMAVEMDQSESCLINLRPITPLGMNLRPMRGWANKPPTINLDWSGALYSPLHIILIPRAPPPAFNIFLSLSLSLTLSLFIFCQSLKSGQVMLKSIWLRMGLNLPYSTFYAI